MNRFIRYLYEYENGKRIRNVGFVKVEAGDEETIVHMQAKGFQNSEDRKLELYLFYVENENIVRIRQAETRITGPALSEHLICSRSDIEDSRGVKTYDMLSGILIETGGGRRMAATWDDKPVDVSRVKEFEPGRSGEAEVPDEREPLDESGQSDDCGCEEKESGHSAPGTEFVALRNEQDTPLEEKNLFPRRENTTKIQIKDISRLPRCEWKLANNQFLVHGYNNFHHLLLIEQGNYLKLGVPGIYHIEEAKCANMFGFEEFISAEELRIGPMPGQEIMAEQERMLNQEGISEQENMENGEWFGYWCRPVRGKFR